MAITPTPETRGRLINLKTNLKSLRFGGDRPASGTSNQPYEIEPIPKGEEYLREGMPTLSGPDFLLRGGITAPFRALKDVSRLVRMFTDTDSPRGIFFTLKENLLSRASVKTQSSFGVGYFAGIMNQGAYLPIGTILDAGLGWAGVHLNKNGINPIGSLGGPSGMNRGVDNPLDDPSDNQLGVGSGALNLYSAVVKNNQLSEINRLVYLQHFVARGESAKSRDVRDANNLQEVSDFINKGASFKINPKAPEDNLVLYSYGGGPGSILGIGRTRIFKEQPTFDAIRGYVRLSAKDPAYNGIGTGDSNFITPLLVGTDFLNYTNPENNYKPFKQGGAYPRSFSNFVIENALEKTFEKSKIIHKAPNYRNYNKAKRVGLGDPGRHITYAVSSSNGEDVVRTVFNYGIEASQMKALDKITALKPYEGTSVDHSLPVKDLCTFNIAVIKNEPMEGRNAQYLHFRAYINGFTDTYGATWNDVQYVGRGNKFKSYGGFTRDITMGFTIIATSKAELTPMFTKLNFLASTLAPDYNSAGFMRGNMVRMTVGGYLYETPGVLTSLTYSIPDDTTWEIGIDTEGNKDESVKELPHRIEVSLAFTPIENFLPSRQNLGISSNGELESMGNERFISLQDTNGSLYDDIVNYNQPINESE
jgi:hypothetical protein